eukprot:COSAG01_NODE_6620_length_3574_cov_9.974676_4_plen_165_part_00
MPQSPKQRKHFACCDEPNRPLHAACARSMVRVRVEMLGSQNCGIVGKSQPVLMMIDPMISTRTRNRIVGPCPRDDCNGACTTSSADAVTSQVPPQSRMVRVALGGLLLLTRLPTRSGGAHGGRKSHCACVFQGCDPGCASSEQRPLYADPRSDDVHASQWDDLC